MKKCPNCQSTFDDDKRFCQIDGTSLVDVVEPPQTEDPFKTVVIGQNAVSNSADDPLKTMVISADSKDDDILQIPDVFDPLKTVVISEPLKRNDPVATPPVNEPVVPAPEPPKFSEPDLSPPSFSDLSSNEPVEVDEPEPTVFVPQIDPPKISTPIANPFAEPPKFESPFSSPISEPPKTLDTPQFNVTPLPGNQIQSPFEKKDAFQPPPFKEPEPAFSVPPSPFDSPFNAPNNAVNTPVQTDWSPPPAPMQSWQDQGVGANTPFQPPPVGVGQNQTLAIVSLVLGILSICCYIGWITGPIAFFLGYKQRKNIAENPGEYTGDGLALAGMIVGGILGALWIVFIAIYIIIFGVAAISTGLR